jgi:MFS transporter, FSR family, fosmidomycin resistance protein
MQTPRKHACVLPVTLISTILQEKHPPNSVKRKGKLTALKSRSLAAVSLGHGTIDTFSNVLPIMYPLLATSLRLSYAEVALIATTYSTTVAISQPVFGHIADGVGGRWSAALSIVLATSMMALTGVVGSYPLLLLCVGLSGVGSGAYHPQGAMSASLSGGLKRGTAMSIFSFGGSAGAALGPLVAALVFGTIGLPGTLAFSPVGILMAFVFFRLVDPIPRKPVLAGHEETHVTRGSIQWVGVSALVVIIALRGWAILALTTFVPLLYHSRGLAVDVSSSAIFAMLAAAALGILLGGYLSDHLGRRPVIAVTLALTPVLYLLVMNDNLAISFAAVGALGLLLEASIPVTVVMSQELLPRNVGMASGISMGVGLIAGAAGVSLTGRIADSYGLVLALSLVAIAPALALLATIWLPGGRRRFAVAPREP